MFINVLSWQDYYYQCRRLYCVYRSITVPSLLYADIDMCCFIAKPGTCHRDQFKCRSGECIASSFVCDNVKDCTDFSDEDNCPNSRCNLKQIYCPVTKQCLNRTLQCDGKPDCQDYSDEVHCGGKLPW